MHDDDLNAHTHIQFRARSNAIVHVVREGRSIR